MFVFWMQIKEMKLLFSSLFFLTTYSAIFLVEKLTLQVEEDSKPECKNTPTTEGDLSLSLSLSLSQSCPQIVNSSTFFFLFL
jgi:hypothetical protein